MSTQHNIVSLTARQIGYGRDRWKYVTGLLPGEQAAVDAGEVVLFLAARRSGGSWGSYWRQVRKGGRPGRYYPRTVSRQQVEAYDLSWEATQ